MPAPRPRLVATDLDGTLVRSDGTVSDYTRDVLLELDRRDVPVVFVTGRPLRWAEEVFEHVGSHGLAVVSNGALVWTSPASGSTLERPIEPGARARGVRAGARGGARARRSRSSRWRGISLEHGFRERYGAPAGSRRGSIEELFDRAGAEAARPPRGARGPGVLGRRRGRRRRPASDHLVVATALLEISGPGVTKASTLALLCADLGIDAADVIAFGDMPNDLPMLTLGGHVVRDGRRPPERDRGGRPRGPGPRRGRRGPGARWCLRPVIWCDVPRVPHAAGRLLAALVLAGVALVVGPRPGRTPAASRPRPTRTSGRPATSSPAR